MSFLNSLANSTDVSYSVRSQALATITTTLLDLHVLEKDADAVASFVSLLFDIIVKVNKGEDRVLRAMVRPFSVRSVHFVFVWTYMTVSFEPVTTVHNCECPCSHSGCLELVSCRSVSLVFVRVCVNLCTCMWRVYVCMCI